MIFGLQVTIGFPLTHEYCYLEQTLKCRFEKEGVAIHARTRTALLGRCEPNNGKETHQRSLQCRFAVPIVLCIELWQCLGK
jgi:hypothetical protein